MIAVVYLIIGDADPGISHGTEIDIRTLPACLCLLIPMPVLCIKGLHAAAESGRAVSCSLTGKDKRQLIIGLDQGPEARRLCVLIVIAGTQIGVTLGC